MPTYEYECGNCGHAFEKFQSMTDEPLKRCPKCRHKVKRLLGAGGGIIFKGSGFYQTDYRSDSYTKKAKEEKSSADSGGDAGKSKKEDKSGGGAASKSGGTAASKAEPKAKDN